MSSRRPHRKRISALKLSSDTSVTLPEYLPGWGHQQRPLGLSNVNAEDPLDKPPDYPDSAEEADEDTDSESNVVFLSPSTPTRPRTASPRYVKRFPLHRRRHSQLPEPPDPYLDSLLERSVNALEMSNTLLQSSISTQSSLSAILASDSPADSSLEARAVGLSSRIKDSWNAKATWADDLEEISRNVEGLFIEHGNSGSTRRQISFSKPRSPEGTGNISCSLPSSSSFAIHHKNRRRPSLEQEPRLHLSPQNRGNLISPPPRALTQYAASTHDPDSILLPSTIGLRSTSSFYHSDLASSSTTNLLSTQSSSVLPPKLTDKPLEPSTPAYAMLSSFVLRPPSSCGSATPSVSSQKTRRRDSSNASTSTERSRRASPSPGSRLSLDNTRQGRSISMTYTPKRGISPVHPMTPPVEESSSSSDGVVAKRTVQSLRKILDEQPTPPPISSPGHRLKAPAFMPRTPAPSPESATSTATASVSKLFTKGIHSSSTRVPSPPRQSAMKRQTIVATLSPVSSTSAIAESLPITPSPSLLGVPNFVSKVLRSRGGGVHRVATWSSASSSGQSTPSKRISFAELPESYASTRPSGSSSRFGKDKTARKRRKGGDDDSAGRMGKGKAVNDDESDSVGWLGGWLGGPGLSNFASSLGRHEERAEDRMTRSWGGRMNAGFGGGLDEWAV